MKHRSLRKLGVVIVAAGAFVALTQGDAQAHFPLFDLPPSPIVEVKKTVDLDMSYGHFFLGDRYAAQKPEWVGIAAVGGRPRNYTAAIKSTTGPAPRWRLKFKPSKSGDYVIGWHAGMFHERPERRVLDFCKIVLHARTDSGTQVGWDRALGSPLEILPLTRPYAIPVGSTFRGRVVRHVEEEGSRFKRAEPVPHMIVEGETRSRPLPRRGAYLPHFRLNVKTDLDGEFAVTLPQKGWWMLSAATDGGPGQQGTSKILQRRAVMLVHVGETVWDTPDPDPDLSKALNQGAHDFSYEGSLRECLAILSEELSLPIKARDVELEKRVKIVNAKGTAAEVCDAIALTLGLAWRRTEGVIEFYTA